MLIKEPKKRSAATSVKNETIPEALIYEVMNGQPLYHRGYKDVLSKKKSLEDITGSSTLQSFIISYLLRFIFKNIDEKKYLTLTNQLGIHLSNKTNFLADVVIFDRLVLTSEKINKMYADVSPEIVFEVDTKIDISSEKDPDYVNIKTQKLLDFGVEKVIWLFTESQKVMIAKKDSDWLTKDWHQDIELLDGHSFNIGQYLEEEGIKVESNF